MTAGAGVIDHVLSLSAGTMWEETPAIKELKPRSFWLTLEHQWRRPQEACQEEIPYHYNCLLMSEKTKTTPKSQVASN